MTATPIGYAGTAVTGVGTSHVVALPANIVEPELILVLARLTTPTTITGLDGFEVLGSGGGNGLHILGRIARGDEGSTVTGTGSATFTTAGATASQWQVRQIAGAYAQLTGVETAIVTGSSNTANPPSLTPSWGEDNIDNLWIAAARSTTSQSWVYPTDYGDGQSVGGTLASAWLQLQTLTQDPGTFAITNEAWVAATIAVRAFEVGAIDDVEEAGGAGAAVRGPIYYESGPPQVEIDEV